MHKFLLAHNPQAPESGGLWIIHLPDPQSIIEAVLIGEMKIHSKNAVYSKKYKYQDENWQLRLYHCYVKIENWNEENEKQFCEKLLDDAWQWYLSYLIWEDKNIDNHELNN